MNHHQAEREIENLENELACERDPVKRAALITAINDIGRELAESERWLDEGRERGWL